LGDRLNVKPGAAIKALRGRRGWTLAEASRRTGLGISALSKVENDRTDLSFEKLVMISKGLEIDIAELFGSASAEPSQLEGSGRRSVSRAGEGRVIETDYGSYLYIASDLMKKKMIPIIGEVFAKDINQYGRYLKHGGEEYLQVLEGTLELHTEIYAPLRLEVGDSVYFDSGMPHAYIAVGDAPCRVLSMCATTEAQLLDDLEVDHQRLGPSATDSVPDKTLDAKPSSTPAAAVKRSRKRQGETV